VKGAVTLPSVYIGQQPLDHPCTTYVPPQGLPKASCACEATFQCTAVLRAAAALSPVRTYPCIIDQPTQWVPIPLVREIEKHVSASKLATRRGRFLQLLPAE